MTNNLNINSPLKHTFNGSEQLKFVEIDPAYLSSLGMSPTGQRYASFVYNLNNAEGSSGEPASSSIIQIGGIAETGTPVPVDDGDAVPVWMDEYGRIILFGANLSLNALDVNVINDPSVSRLDTTSTLSGAMITGAGDSIDVSIYKMYTVHTISSEVTGGATVEIQTSIDGVNFATIAIRDITSNGVDEVSISNQVYKYIRGNITSYTDGIYTTIIYAGT